VVATICKHTWRAMCVCRQACRQASEHAGGVRPPNRGTCSAACMKEDTTKEQEQGWVCQNPQAQAGKYKAVAGGAYCPADRPQPVGHSAGGRAGQQQALEVGCTASGCGEALRAQGDGKCSSREVGR